MVLSGEWLNLTLSLFSLFLSEAKQLIKYIMFKSNIIQTKDLSHSLFLGADIHKNNHTFVALNNLEQKVGQCLVTDEELEKLRAWIEELKDSFEDQVILGLEDNNGNGRLISGFLVGCGYPVYGINPCLTAQRRKRTIHQDKSDAEDALLVAKTLISELDNLSQVKITRETETANQLKGIVDDYDSLVKNQTQIKNQLHKVLYQEYGAEYHRLFKDPFSQKALRYWLNQNEGAYKDSLDLRNPRLAVAPPQLKNIRKSRIRQKVKYLMFIQEQLKDLTGIIKKLFFLLPYQNLLTLPGCGILLGSRVVSEIKDISRFENSSKLARYAGISPQENSSGQSKKHKRSRFGNRQLNKAFYRISLSQIGGHKNTKAASYYQRKIKEGKSKKRALKSLVRRNVNIVFAMMRDKSQYDINYKRKS